MAASYLLEAGRSLVWAAEYVAVAFGAAFCLMLLFAVWAALGMRRAEAAGGSAESCKCGAP